MNLAIARHILLINGYPLNFINHHINLRLERLQSNSPLQTIVSVDDDRGRRSLVLPFSERLSAKLRRLLRKYDLGLISKITNKFSKLFGSTKDKLDPNLRWNLIYKVDCSDCGLMYVGQTGQYLKDRMSQHQGAIGKIVSSGRTALTKHAQILKHSFDFNNVKVLEQETSRIKRNFLEMFHIKKNIQSTINYRTDTKKLSICCNPLFY